MPNFVLSRHAVEWWAHHNFDFPAAGEPDTFLQQKGAYLMKVLGTTNVRAEFDTVLKGDMMLFPEGISESTPPTTEVLAVFALVMRHVILSGREASAVWDDLSDPLRQVSSAAPDHEAAWQYWDARMREWQTIVNANTEFTEKFGRVADLDPLSAEAPPPIAPEPGPLPPPPRETEMRILRRQLAAVREDLDALRVAVTAVKRKARETETWDQDDVLDLLDELELG
jgi:hypothetical protein